MNFKNISAFVASIMITISCTAYIPNASAEEYTYRQNTNYMQGILKTAKEKKFYNDMLSTCNKINNDDTTTYDSITVSYDGMLSTAKITELYDIFLGDHPEFFWMGESSYGIMSKNNSIFTIVTIKLNPDYDTGAERKAAKDKIYSIAKNYINGAMSQSSEKEKVKYIYTNLIKDITYDYGDNSSKEQTIASALINKYTVCAGYSTAFSFLCTACGIDTVCVFSPTRDHEWNMVKVDGNWYCVDVTFDDSGTTSTYAYFLKPYTSFKNTNVPYHQISSSQYPTYYQSIISLPTTSSSSQTVKKSSQTKGASTLGDVNYDGFVDSKDATSVLVDYAKSLVGNSSSLNLTRADLNGDNRSDAKDATLILKYYAYSLTVTKAMTSEEFISKN